LIDIRTNMIATTTMTARIAPMTARCSGVNKKAVSVRKLAKIPGAKTTTSAMVRGGRAGRGCVSTRASAGDDDGAEVSTSDKDEKFDLETAFANLASRYDWLSAGIGALMGTSYGVVRGQPPSQALGIAVCATVVALAIDEILKENKI